MTFLARSGLGKSGPMTLNGSHQERRDCRNGLVQQRRPNSLLEISSSPPTASGELADWLWGFVELDATEIRSLFDELAARLPPDDAPSTIVISKILNACGLDRDLDQPSKRSTPITWPTRMNQSTNSSRTLLGKSRIAQNGDENEKRVAPSVGDDPPGSRQRSLEA